MVVVVKEPGENYLTLMVSLALIGMIPTTTVGRYNLSTIFSLAIWIAISAFSFNNIGLCDLNRNLMSLLDQLSLILWMITRKL